MEKKLETLTIGNRRELFVDSYLIQKSKGVSLRLNAPQRREIVLRLDSPWEGSGSGCYNVVMKDGDVYRMFYRGTFPDKNEPGGEGCCYAESGDGIHWEKKNLGLVSYKGQDTNMILTGDPAHNFSPFIDTNPACPPEEKYKAVGGHLPRVLSGFTSADCFHWERVQEAPLLTDGAFDSQNIAFYDLQLGKYVCYSRYFDEGDPADGVSSRIRAIQRNLSEDFLHWDEPERNVYDEGVPLEQFYTNATVRCPGAEHIYLSFPMRFMADRHKILEHPKVGVSDNVMMSSRDGVHWSRPFLESWMRPGPDQRNWTQRNLIVAQGILETGDDFSLFVNENYQWDSAYIRRVTVPRFRFGSAYGEKKGGMFQTQPILFEHGKLRINYATSAPGSVRVGIVDENGWPLPRYSPEDCDVIYGDELERDVTWRGSSDLSFLRGKVVRFKFELRDADVYAMQIL